MLLDEFIREFLWYWVVVLVSVVIVLCLVVFIIMLVNAIIRWSDL